MSKREKKTMSEMKEQVERFIQRFYSLEVVMSPESHKIPVKSGQVFSDSLANAITNYECEKDNPEKLVFCIGMINRAYSHGLLQQGTDLITRLDDCGKKGADLLRDLATCMANYSALQTQHQRLVQMLEQNQNTPSENNE